MSNIQDSGSDSDDDFSELYKEYTGPIRSNTTTTTTAVFETAKASKRSRTGSHEEDESLDPNAVPTDFTSRDAKFWDAKSKATEINWKKRKEEEMTCKLCGESTHYTQGCPSTLGANRKSQGLFTRVPARDPQVKALFTERVIKKIETDIGCKIKMEEKFIIVTAKDGPILSKGVDAVYTIKNEGDTKGESDVIVDRSKSPKGRSPVNSQRSSHSPRNALSYNQWSGRQDKVVEEHVREEFHKCPRGSPQAYGNDGGRSRSTHSKSPARPSYTSGSYSVNDNHIENRTVHRNEVFSQTLEELDLEYKRNAIVIAKVRDKEEDEENLRHREAVKELRESYMRKLVIVREMHAKQWEKFLQQDTRKRQQQARQQIPTKHNGYYDYSNAPSNPYSINIPPMDARVEYQELDNYSALRSNNNYESFQHQRHEEYGEPYNRY
ncbi:uncharacterized protein [Rutidosis leptorrhynchoides]|uniref:uncharacterized protein n=1 Tax=Rutidosis leptorrhynchoides TaxID=125765 RepID=UPI003A991142